MKDKQVNNNVTSKKALLGGTESINDLRDKEFNGKELTPQQRLALKNFDRYRISVLNQQTSEKAFHNAYFKLQVMANLSSYDEFLKEEYFL
ncbi:MAG: hypothetical protein KDD29_03615 [Flavobacteriales bacterium]|nr:hypothetical protein [Flavobacteriales bacterium]